MNLEYLSDVELLENFMPKEAAQNILREYSSIYSVVNCATEKQLKAFKGITAMRAKKILCIRELVCRMQREKKQQLKIITAPKDVIEYFRFLEDKETEEFWVMMLNTPKCDSFVSGNHISLYVIVIIPCKSFILGGTDNATFFLYFRR